MPAARGDEDIDVFAIEGVDALFAEAPSEFVAARDRLAKELRAGGDKEAAKAVKALRRPTVVAAALNQVARAHPDRLDELADAGRALQETYAAVLAGERPGGDLDEPAQRRRRVVAELAGEVAKQAGEAHREEAAGTLEAASLDDAAMAQLRAGRLTAALDPPAGFGFGDAPLPAAPAKATGAPSAAERNRARKRLEKAEDDVERAQERRSSAEDRVRAAEAALERARSELAEAEEAIASAEQARDEAAAAVETLGDD